MDPGSLERSQLARKTVNSESGVALAAVHPRYQNLSGVVGFLKVSLTTRFLPPFSQHLRPAENCNFVQATHDRPVHVAIQDSVSNVKAQYEKPF
jgi:hypothetical protein